MENNRRNRQIPHNLCINMGIRCQACKFSTLHKGTCLKVFNSGLEWVDASVEDRPVNDPARGFH